MNKLSNYDVNHKSLYNVSCVDEYKGDILCIMTDNTEIWWPKKCIIKEKSEVCSLGDTGVLVVDRQTAAIKGY